jgi:hypothetical protein
MTNDIAPFIAFTGIRANLFVPASMMGQNDDACANLIWRLKAFRA